MPAIEQVVRPFQTPVVTPPTVLPYGAPTKTAAPVVFKIITNNAVKTWNGNTSYNSTVYVKKYPKETDISQGDPVLG